MLKYFFLKLNEYFLKKRSKQLSGSALILTMFILASMLMVGLSGSYVVLLGIKAGKIQANSLHSYFAAEAGAERLLWELRKNGSSYPEWSPDVPVFSGSFSGALASYDVYLKSFPPLVFASIGDYQNTRRSVEIMFGL